MKIPVLFFKNNKSLVAATTLQLTLVKRSVISKTGNTLTLSNKYKQQRHHPDSDMVA